MIKLLILQTTPPSEGFGSFMLPMIALLAVFLFVHDITTKQKKKKKKKSLYQN